ncbi:MAG: hypothetical protein ACC645_17485 [Pirellulales bacterium]
MNRADADPAGSDPAAPLPDHFGGGLAVSGDRVVIGAPGFNETDGTTGDISRADVGFFTTFTVDATIPALTNENLWAEILPAGSSESSQTETVYYDEVTRTLFVFSNSGTIDTYVNEGLYWRPTGNVIQLPDLIGPAVSDIDSDGQRLVISSTNELTVSIYEYDGEAWSTTPAYTLDGTTLNGVAFGASVAIEGDRLVVGDPDVDLTYFSTDRVDNQHEYLLGQSGVV